MSDDETVTTGIILQSLIWWLLIGLFAGIFLQISGIEGWLFFFGYIVALITFWITTFLSVLVEEYK